MRNIIEDLEKLTNVKESILRRILSCMEYCIADSAIEETYDGKNIIKCDIGIGKLSIEIIDDCLHYSFKPSPSLETSLISAINDKENVLEEKLSANIDRYIYKTYKDML